MKQNPFLDFDVQKLMSLRTALIQWGDRVDALNSAE
jgi:hypothetical protein